VRARMLSNFGLVVLAMLLAGCGASPGVLVTPLDPVPRLAVISAYEPELDGLLEAADNSAAVVMAFLQE